jgi:hypothetical protein
LEEPKAFIFRAFGCPEDGATACSFDTLIIIYQTTRRNIPEDFTAVSTSNSHIQKKDVEHEALEATLSCFD